MIFGKNTRFVGKLIGELAVSLPLSLLGKLADGKLTREELTALIQEITAIVAKVIVMEYQEKMEDKDFDYEEVLGKDI